MVDSQADCECQLPWVRDPISKKCTKCPITGAGSIIDTECVCSPGRKLEDSGRGFYRCLVCKEPVGSRYENGVCVCPPLYREKEGKCVKCPENSSWNSDNLCQCHEKYQKTESEQCIKCFGPGQGSLSTFE